MMTTIPDFVQLWPSICLSSHCWFLQVTFGRNWSKKMTKTLFSSICYHINLRIINMIRQYCINLFTLLVHVFGCSAGFCATSAQNVNHINLIFFIIPIWDIGGGLKNIYLLFLYLLEQNLKIFVEGLPESPLKKLCHLGSSQMMILYSPSPVPDRGMRLIGLSTWWPYWRARVWPPPGQELSCQLCQNLTSRLRVDQNDSQHNNAHISSGGIIPSVPQASFLDSEGFLNSTKIIGLPKKATASNLPQLFYLN